MDNQYTNEQLFPDPHSRGIDYGLGMANVDRRGPLFGGDIRYGVIPSQLVLQAWADESEADYGDPACPECGGPVVDSSNATARDENGDDPDRDYFCKTCRKSFWSDVCFGDEPYGHYYGTKDAPQDGYFLHSDSDGDIWVELSPYYTRAQFCSPCAPGAGWLASPSPDGEKTYCLGPDWFTEPELTGSCPYPVWRVSDDILVYVPGVGDVGTDQ